MNKTKTIGIIGVGKFGFSLGSSLIEMEQRVIGVDKSAANLKLSQDIFTQVFEADATDATALKQLGFENLDYVVICVGESMEASILILLHLQELGVQHIWVKAISTDHEKILTKLGVDKVIFPEQVAAQQLAHQITIPGLIEILPFWKDVALHELEIDQWQGKTLKELNMIERFEIQVVAIKKKGGRDYKFVPRADYRLFKGDLIVVIGKEESLENITT